MGSPDQEVSPDQEDSLDRLALLVRKVFKAKPGSPDQKEQDTYKKDFKVIPVLEDLLDHAETPALQVHMASPDQKEQDTYKKDFKVIPVLEDLLVRVVIQALLGIS